MIDYSVDSRFRKMGFGNIILQKAFNQIKLENKAIFYKAEVKKENVASAKIFQKIGFILVKEENEILTYEFK